MAGARMMEESREAVAHHLPLGRTAGLKSGGFRTTHRGVIRAFWFVLSTGGRWVDVTAELGCSGRTAHWSPRALEETGVWDRPHADLLAAPKRATSLGPDAAIVDSVAVRPFGRGVSGPSPMDRRKPGARHTLMDDRHGMLLAVRTIGANASDASR